MTIEALVLTRWIGAGTAADPNRPAIADELASSLLAWEDVAGQPADRVGRAPRLVIVRVRVADIKLADVSGDARQAVIAWRTLDDGDGRETQSNQSAALTVGQANAVKTWATNRGLDASAITAGMTRLAAAGKLRELLEGDTAAPMSRPT